MTHRKEDEGQHRRSLHGCLAKYVKRPIPQEEWAEVREQAWAFAIREKEAALAAETGSAVRGLPRTRKN